MELKFNVTGARRKELVQAVSEILDTQAEYKGAPTFAYVIGNFTVTKEGSLSFNETAADIEITVERLIEQLEQRGFEMEILDKLVIELPRENFSDTAVTNLERLVKSKESLIKKALGLERLPIEKTEDRIIFPWFSGKLTAEEVNAYARFIGALYAMAKTQQRVTATEKPAGNQKYAFRCFLLRLGFIGPEHKEERKILLSKLTGNAAFKNGPQTAEAAADA